MYCAHVGVITNTAFGAEVAGDNASNGAKEGKLSGNMVDQSSFYTDLKNTTFQDNANEAIHRFIK